VASVVSAGLILVVLLWVGPYFETLPRCVLAGIIIVALKGMLMQIKELKSVRKEGIFETMVWVGTFLSVVIIDIDIGLMMGICISLLALYIKGWKAYDCLLGEIPETGIYVDLATHKGACEVPDTKIFRYTGSLNFASKSGFKKSLFDKVGVDTKVMRRASVFAGRHEATGLQGMHTLIIDLSCIAHVDVSACKMFNEIKKEMQLLGVAFLLASPTDRVYDALMHSESYNGASFKIFATVHDAVLYVQGKLDLV
jgi:solute carrier family 26, other